MSWLKKYKNKMVDGGIITNNLDYSVWRPEGIEDGQWIKNYPKQEITDNTSSSESNNTQEPQQQEETADDSQQENYASQITSNTDYEKIYSINSSNSSPSFNGFSGSRPRPTMTDVAPAKQDTTGKAVYDGLINRGLNSLVASAITGNIAGESNFKLNADNPTSHAQGLIQWLGKRKKDFNKFAAETGRATNDLNLQLDFIVKELGSTHKYVADALSKAKTPQEATKIVLDKYEAPSMRDRKQSYPKRLKNTLAYFQGENGATIDSNSHWLNKYTL